MQNDINKTLLEVRKAYRFLYEYQSRILDLISFIGGKLGFSYNGGYPKFSNVSPRKGGGNLNDWAWDWMNLYYYEFNFKTKDIDNNNTISFSVLLVNDSGYFDARDMEGAKGVSKKDPSTFKPVGSSESKLVFVAGKNKWGGLGEMWDNPEFISKPIEIIDDEKDENKLMVFRHYSLAEFENQDKAMSCIKDFVKHCSDNNINLNAKIDPFG